MLYSKGKDKKYHKQYKTRSNNLNEYIGMKINECRGGKECSLCRQCPPPTLGKLSDRFFFDGISQLNP